MVSLSEAYVKIGDIDTAASLFGEFFKALDGRSELQASASMSIKSKLSRGLSIRTRSNVSVAYKGLNSLNLDNSKDRQNPSPIQRIAITLCQR
jgi:hypothetical protein